MVLLFAEVKIFRFWPKTMDYSKAFWPKLSSSFGSIYSKVEGVTKLNFVQFCSGP